VLNANGTLVMTDFGSPQSGTFSVSGNNITITLSGEEPMTGTFVLVGDTLTLSMAEWDWRLYREGAGGITWSAAPSPGIPTPSIILTFQGTPAGLVASDISIFGSVGSATRGDLTGSENTWTVAISDVRAGIVGISIDRDGISRLTQWVTLVGAEVTPPQNITWTALPTSGTPTPSITLNFQGTPTGLVASDITITPGNGSATRGALTGTGNTRTLAISNVNAGTISISINRTGIASGPATVTLVGPGTTQPPTGTVPAIPSGLTAEATSTSAIRISWDNVPAATEFVIFRSTNATSGFTEVHTTGLTSWTNTGLAADTTFHFRVAARNSHGTSQQSASVSARTQAPPQIINAITVTGVPQSVRGNNFAAQLILIPAAGGTNTPSNVVTPVAASTRFLVGGLLTGPQAGRYIVEVQIRSLVGGVPTAVFRTQERQVNQGDTSIAWSQFSPFTP